MSGRKNTVVLLGFVISVSLLASALGATLVSYRDSRLQFELLNAVCGEIVEREPEAGEMISDVLKEYTQGMRRNVNVDGYEMGKAPSEGNTGRNADTAGERDVLTALGYRVSDFAHPSYQQNTFFAMAGFLAGILLFLSAFLYRNQKEARRIHALADYLEQVNTGRAVILSATGEDDFSKLEDEIYKTVTYLYQTKDGAVQAKNDFAKNLSNIAHQIKTPITAISLSVQMMKQELAGCFGQLRAKEPETGRGHLEQVEKQLLRLTHLEEALLVLSRLDAGALVLQKNQVDVFTLLVLAADNLQELFVGSGTSIDIPELGEMGITADLDWTMEAVMNLMKNGMEHNKGGTVHCSYEQNPLYTEILIWDEGEGFAKEDIPHLFERFYRGKNAEEGGIGIGLALSKEIIERQNGTIRAKNRQGGGACFEIRFYRH